MISNKPFHEMTDDELRAEWKYWNGAVRNAPGWSASLAAAHEFREECEIELKRRGHLTPLDAKEAP